MLKIIEVAYEGAIKQYYKEQKNEQNRKDIVQYRNNSEF